MPPLDKLVSGGHRSMISQVQTGMVGAFDIPKEKPRHELGQLDLYFGAWPVLHGSLLGIRSWNTDTALPSSKCKKRNAIIKENKQQVRTSLGF